MPLKGGRSGGSRGIRSSAGSRAARSSSSGSRGFRLNIGDRAARSSVNVPNTNINTPTSNPVSNPTSHPTNYNPTLRPRLTNGLGTGWRIVAIIIGLFLLSMCACVGLGFMLQALGYG